PRRWPRTKIVTTWAKLLLPNGREAATWPKLRPRLRTFRGAGPRGVRHLIAPRRSAAHTAVVVPKGGDESSGRRGTFATIATIIVAVLGLLSSTVWGPPICRAVGVCADEGTAAPNRPEATASGPSTPGTSPTRREEGTGYPASAGDYCAEFVRAW